MGILENLFKGVIGAAASSVGINLNASASDEFRELEQLCQALRRARSEESKEIYVNQIRVHYTVLKNKALQCDYQAEQYFDLLNKKYRSLFDQYQIR